MKNKIACIVPAGMNITAKSKERSMHTIIFTSKAMAAIGPYNQAIRAGNLVFTSGQLGIDPRTGKLVEGLEAQVHMSFNNLRTVLQEAGSKLSDVVKFNIYLTDMDNFEKVNDIMKFYLNGIQHPARTCNQPAALPKGALFLVDAVAVVPSNSEAE